MRTMKPRDLPTSLDLLRGFEASARLLSFTAAAAELFITQSAVSRQVQQLEEQLGVKLFERRTRALVLTDAGDRYYREVSNALNRLREATAAVRARTTPIVRVTTTLTFASLWLVPRLATFQSTHPEISVHVVADNIVRDLERNSLDVALRYCPEEMAGAGAERLFGEQVAPVCTPALVKGQRVRSVEELLRWPLIELEDPTGLAPWLSWKVWCEAMGVGGGRARRGLTFSHYDQVVPAAAAGQGIALGRFPLLDPFVAERRLVLPLKGRQYATLERRAYWLVVAPAAAQRPEIQTFVGWMRKQVGVSEHPASHLAVSKAR
jgi:LysR family transcriptional regulator, glycine cleavage system transcriptional activator